MRYGIGLEIGITSIGFATMEIDETDRPFRIVNLGTRIFDKPENPQKKISLAVQRRTDRSSRRRLRRRKHRKERLRRLIIRSGLLDKSQFDELQAKFANYQNENMYQMRRNALNRLVSNEELARILIHISQRRGYNSNTIEDESDKDAGRMLTAVQANDQIMASGDYRTVAEMLCDRQNQRNKGGEYTNTVSRKLMQDETHKIFAAQRSFGNSACTADFEEKYCEIIFKQRPFSEGPGAGSPYGGFKNMIGYCTYHNGKDGKPLERRAPKASYTFERFSLLQKINNIKLESEDYPIQLNADQRNAIKEEAYKTQKMTYKHVRKVLNLDENYTFNMVDYSDSESISVAESKTKFEFLNAYHSMKKALQKKDENGKPIKSAKNPFSDLTTATKDKIAEIFTLHKDSETLQAKLDEVETLTTADKQALLANLKPFSEFGSLSIGAMQNISLKLQQGITYLNAIEELDYKPKNNRPDKATKLSLRHFAERSKEEVTSPTNRRALSKAMQVVNAIIGEMGKTPVYINVEFTAQMSETIGDRGKIDRRRKESRANSEKIRQTIKELGHANPSGQDIIKYRLHKLQDGICPYSQEKIELERLFEVGYAEIDHIVPYSVSLNDRYDNKVLTFASTNTAKADKLPLEYLRELDENRKNFEDDENDENIEKLSENFIVYVENSKFSRYKKNNLLKKKVDDYSRAAYLERNTEDDTHLSRLLRDDYLPFALVYDDFKTVQKSHVNTLNYGITSQIFRRLGLSTLHEDNDLQHAVQAAVIACTTKGMINDIQIFSKMQETNEQAKNGRFPEPYPQFVCELEMRLSPNPKQSVQNSGLPTYTDKEISQIKPIMASRVPNRKITGKMHKDTIMSYNPAYPEYLIKRVAITELKLDSKGEIADYYRPESDSVLYNALKDKLKEHDGNGKTAFVEPFYKPKANGEPGNIVRTVKLFEKSSSNVAIRKGMAKNDDMVRIDVFNVPGKGYYFVPIYVMDTLKAKLPIKAAVKVKQQTVWEEMLEENFVFSLYPNDLVRIVSKNTIKFKDSEKLPMQNEVSEAFAYYRNADAPNGTIKIFSHDSKYQARPSIKGLVSLEKWQVDVLGNVSKVKSEPRQKFTQKFKKNLAEDV